MCRVFKTIAPSHRVQEMPDAVLRPWVCVTPRERSFVGLQEDRPAHQRRGAPSWPPSTGDKVEYELRWDGGSPAHQHGQPHDALLPICRALFENEEPIERNTCLAPQRRCGAVTCCCTAGPRRPSSCWAGGCPICWRSPSPATRAGAVREFADHMGTQEMSHIGAPS